MIDGVWWFWDKRKGKLKNRMERKWRGGGKKEKKGGFVEGRKSEQGN